MTTLASRTPTTQDARDERWRLVDWARETADAYVTADVLALALDHEAEAFSAPELLALLAEVRRREQDGCEPTAGAELLAATVRAILHKRRANDEAGAVAEQVSREPLRVLALSELALEPQRPKVLAERIGTGESVVSRLLKALLAEGLVVVTDDEDDRRGRCYALTDSGVRARLRHARSRPVDDGRDPFAELVEQERLAEELCQAVVRRRATNSLTQARTRLVAVINDAAGLSDRSLWLRASFELCVTLRQAGATEAWATSVDLLDAVARGDGPALSSQLCAPAGAYVQYERGRDPSASTESRVGRLTAAGFLFEDLGVSHALRAMDRWPGRRAWARFAAADVLRQQTDFGVALEMANLAARDFAKDGDEYGFANAVFLVGFCLRLRGHFAQAETVLGHVTGLAESGGFERLRANCLLQHGETLRSVGRLQDASSLLQEALTLATKLKTHTTRAFAQSSLGAVAYAEQDRARAVRHLRAAGKLFDASGHGDGLALNTRREAVVLRATRRRGADLERADALIAAAQTSYKRLESPAGLAACVIEAGRVRVEQGETPDRECRRLLRLVKQATSRRFIVLDPWLPGNLERFAQDAEHNALLEAIVPLKVQADRTQDERLTHHDWQFVRDHTGAVGVVDAPDAGVDAMAGEPRRFSAFADDSGLLLMTRAS